MYVSKFSKRQIAAISEKGEAAFEVDVARKDFVSA